MNYRVILYVQGVVVIRSDTKPALDLMITRFDLIKPDLQKSSERMTL